jgi:uncharacterized protein (DUF2249 family)
VQTSNLIGRLDAPSGRPTSEIDVRQSPPPEPLTRTLERLTELHDGAADETAADSDSTGRDTTPSGPPVVLQHNDRVPRHLFPKLDDRGFEYDYVETADHVVTAIWKE